MPEQEPTAPESAQPPADGQPAEDDAAKNARMRREDGRFTSLSAELRTVSTERDQLREQVTALHRREAERIAGTSLAVPSDLFDLGGAQLDDLVADGAVDPDKVKARVDELLQARPGLARPKPPARLPSHLPPSAPGSQPETLETILRRRQASGAVDI
jgi:hypothetical protein